MAQKVTEGREVWQVHNFVCYFEMAQNSKRNEDSRPKWFYHFYPGSLWVKVYDNYLIDRHLNKCQKLVKQDFGINNDWDHTPGRTTDKRVRRRSSFEDVGDKIRVFYKTVKSVNDIFNIH